MCLPVGSNIEQFTAVASPARRNASTGRNRNPPATSEERSDVYFGASRLIGLVRNPSAVARKLSEFVVEGRLHDWKGLVLASERQRLDVPSGLFAGRRIQDEAAVCGPIQRGQILPGNKSLLLL